MNFDDIKLTVKHEDGTTVVYHAEGCHYGGADHDGSCVPPAVAGQLDSGQD